MKYVVLFSKKVRQEIIPFAGCFLIEKETGFYIWVKVSKITRDGLKEKIEQFQKGLVVCYTNTDISSKVDALNETIRESYKKHTNLVNHVIHLMKMEGKLKGEPR